MRTTTFFSALFFSIISLKGQTDQGLIGKFLFNSNFINENSPSILINEVGTAAHYKDRNGNPISALLPVNNSYLEFTDNDLKVPFPISISVWVNLSSVSDYNEIFVSDNEYNNYTGYWLTTVGGTGQINMGFGGDLGGASSTNRRSLVSDTTLSLNTWHHLVVIYNDYQDMKMYLDCKQVFGQYSGTGSQNVVYQQNSPSRIAAWIGATSSPNGQYFDGVIDDLLIYERALSPADIETLCDKTYEITSVKEEAKQSTKVLSAADQTSLQFISANSRVISIFGPSGKLISTHPVAGSTFTLQHKNLSKGLYFIQINEKGSREVLKVIIQ